MDVGSTRRFARALAVLLLSAPLLTSAVSADDAWFADEAPWVEIEPCSFGGSAGLDDCFDGMSASSLCTAPNLTGTWGGLRTCAAENGILYDPRLTQFYQGVAHGGQQEIFRYGAKLDQFVN